MIQTLHHSQKLTKWIRDLNIKYKVIKLLEYNIGENLWWCILYTSSNIWSMKGIIDKLDFIKITKFCSVKNNIKIIRRQATDREKYLQKIDVIKDCYSKYTKNLQNSTIRKPTTWSKVDQRPEPTPHQSRSINGKQANERVLHMTCHDGNAS